jgi:hypothetical protein
VIGIIVVAHRWYPWGWSLLLVICVSVRGSLRKPVSRIGGCECLGHEETHRGLLYLPPVHLCSQEGVRAALTTTGKLSHTRTLRADPPSEQQVQSKVSLCRAVDAV